MQKHTQSIIKIVVVTLLIYAMGCLYSAQNMLEQTNRQIIEVGAELAKLEEENAVLASKIEQGTDDGIMEELARERLGMVMPGEIIFYFTEG